MFVVFVWPHVLLIPAALAALYLVARPTEAAPLMSNGLWSASVPANVRMAFLVLLATLAPWGVIVGLAMMGV